MSVFQSPKQTDSAPDGEETKKGDDLREIRNLLFGEEAKQISGIRERLNDPKLHAQDLSRALPQAVTISSAESGQLAIALVPAVETALQESVRRDPSPLVNAIFPIIGPAIRKSVAEAFNRLVQSLNQTLDHSLSAQGLKWRLEALRTGRSFTEVVLAHTLVYRVEQVFLIQKETGILLQHVRALNIQKEGADMVSGLLTAIQDFARDSFRLGEGDALQNFQVGDLNVWLETSPMMTLAAVIRGHAPLELRAVLQTALENIHREHAGTWRVFNGDTDAFESAQPHLECCVQAHYVRPERKTPIIPVLVLVLALVLLGVWIFFSVRDSRRWTHYVERLKNEPGIMVVESGKSGGKFYVTGWRDPLAEDPAGFLETFHVPRDKMSSRWEPYHALSSEMVQRRAIQMLQPPATTSLNVRDGVLFAEGSASADWIQSARQRATSVAGIDRLDTSGLIDETGTVISQLARAIDGTILFFEDGIQLKPEQDATVDSLAKEIIHLQETAQKRNQIVRVHVIGHTDSSGTEEKNLRVSYERANLVRSLFLARGVPSALLVLSGIGSKELLHDARPGQAEIQNRRVTFKAVLEAASPTSLTQ